MSGVKALDNGVLNIGADMTKGGVDVDCLGSPALHLRELTLYNVLLEEWYQEPLGSAKPSCSRC